jgi:hypothetical protein
VSDTKESPHRDLFRRLAAPFEPSEIEWKAQAVKDNRALAVAYIDARCVEDRLDAVVGPDCWEDEYVLLPDGNVECRLSLWVGGNKRTKTDVGGESEQKDVGDKRKASYSDALKRAAVKWGIGRYLYSLPAQWCDYDPQRKQLKGTPKLPDWALPGKAATPSPAMRPAPAVPSAEHDPEPVPVETVERLDAMLRQLKVAPADVRRRLLEKYGVKDLNLLTPGQAADLEEALRKSIVVQKNKTPATANAN